MEKHTEAQAALHRMQAAIALSPANKAKTTMPNGDTFIVQEYAHERYRMWVVPPDDIPIWSGVLSEKEIDELPTKYNVEPGYRIWEPMGMVPDTSTDYKAVEAAFQILSGLIINLRTELLVVKGLLNEIASKQEHPF
jgi:hypothetical protein